MARSQVLNDQPENAEYADMLRRMLRAAGRRAGDGDVEDLAELIGLRADLERAIAYAVSESRRVNGRSWDDIARAAGTTRQAAWERWSERRP